MTTLEITLIAIWLTLMVAITEACFGFPVTRKLATWVRKQVKGVKS